MYLLTICCVTDRILEAEDIVMRKMDKASAPVELISQKGRKLRNTPIK
jgi:hypothetical protein